MLVTRSFRPSLLTLAILPLLAGSVGSARAQSGHPLYICANRLAGDLREFSSGLVDAVANCATNGLRTTGTGNCAQDAAVQAKIATFASTFADDMARCSDAEVRALCSFEARDLAHLVPAVTAADVAATVRVRLTELVVDLFETPYASCARPTGRVTTNQASCADRIRTVVTDQSDALAAEYFGCEKNNLASSVACVDPEVGEPNSPGLETAVAGVLGDVSAITSRCTDADVVTLGCPLAARTATGLVEALALRLGSLVQELNLQVFHSSCRTDAGGARPPLVPADATLAPSLRKVKISCGQRLDSAFFGSDRELDFDSDLDCGPADTATDGIVVARSGVKITGRGKTWAITGPSSRRLRTGAGIRLESGASDVRVTGFRTIQYFGTGIAGDFASNRRLRVEKSTVFRNVEAGIRSSAQRTRVAEVIADRNGIGFDLSGDGSILGRSIARRSEPQSTSATAPLSPGVGIRLGGVDKNNSGLSLRVINQTQATANTIGVQMVGSHASIESASVDFNLGNGIEVTGDGNLLKTVSVKLNGGHGVSVSGPGNRLESVGSDQNRIYGFDISGAQTIVTSCGAGSPGGKGNGFDGFHVTGEGGSFDANRAEANGGTGFAMMAPTALFVSNKSYGNLIGFIFETGGSELGENRAETNGNDEFRIAAGNVDGKGNKANGTGFGFDGTGLVVR